jgi:putative membrane protein
MSEAVKEVEQAKITKVEKPLVAVKTGSSLPSLNDCMAVERTIMSNERTLLAYVRTSLAILVVAVTIIKFFSSQGMVILGYILLLVGVVCATLGLMRFTETYQKLKVLGTCADKYAVKDDTDD